MNYEEMSFEELLAECRKRGILEARRREDNARQQ